jgi:hypothetical protein
MTTDDSDFDIDIDDDEILHLQQHMHQQRRATPRNTVLKKIPVRDVVYSGSCTSVVERYKRGGMEINAYLRGGDGDASEFSKIVLNLDKCFKRVVDFFPIGSGNYIKTWRTMSNSFDPNLTAGYTSTSNQFVNMSGRYLYTIYIPCDACVIIIDISKETGTPNTFEVVLERRVRLIDLGDNAFVVDTPFARKNLSQFDNLI